MANTFISDIAFRSSSYILAKMKFLGLVCAIAVSAWWPAGIFAQSESGPPQPPPPPPPERMDKGPGLGQPDGPGNRPDKGPGDSRRHGGGGPSGPGGPPGGMDRGGRERGDIFKNLSEPDRKRVREAFDKVWGEPEVAAARELLMKANDEYRKQVHEALKRIDPGVVEILDRNKPPGGPPDDRFGPGPPNERHGPRVPSFDDPDFVSKALASLKPRPRPDNGPGPDQKNDENHEKVMSKPEVAEALRQLQDANAEARPDAWRKLEGLYRKAMEELRNADKPNPQ